MEKINKLKGNALFESIKEAQKDPNFIKEVKTFIKASTTVYKL